MIPLDLPTLTVVGFAVKASHEGRAILLQLSGRAHVRTGPPLHALLVRLHAEAMRLGVEQVTVDFRGVELMNSASFKSLLTWLDSLQQAQPDRRYRIRFLADAQKQWQRRTLAALGYYAGDVAVDVEEG